MTHPVLIPGVQVTHDPVNNVTTPVVCPVETVRGQFLAARRNIDCARTWTRYLILADRAAAKHLTGQSTWWRRRMEEAWGDCAGALAVRDEWRTEP